MICIIVVDIRANSQYLIMNTNRLQEAEAGGTREAEVARQDGSQHDNSRRHHWTDRRHLNVRSQEDPKQNGLIES